MRQIPSFVATRRGPRRTTLAIAAAATVALLYGLGGCSKPGPDLGPLAHGAMAKLKPTGQPGAEPGTVFHDLQGKALTLAQFKGKVLIVNLWANWCAPCKAEIPSLAKLAAAYAGKPLAVVAVSVGKGDDETAGRDFIARNPPLIFYTEPTYSMAYAFHPAIDEMPTTVIYDRKGIERARLAGGADWSGPDAKAVVDALIAGS
jgi:thiol-disulfide isomerase/thioredoxin